MEFSSVIMWIGNHLRICVRDLFMITEFWGYSSVGQEYLAYIQEIGGSNPSAPTKCAGSSVGRAQHF